MQQRRYRPGDVLDDYCPRERRITDHAIVAMIDDHIKQTRCVVCDAEHEYKDGKVPPQRRKRPQAALFNQVLEGLNGPQPPGRLAPPVDETSHEELVDGETIDFEDAPVPRAAEIAQMVRDEVPAPDAAAIVTSDVTAHAAASVDADRPAREEGPWRRQLIRAALPRPEGQPPPVARPAPEFTIRQPTNARGGQRHGRRRSGSGFAGQGDNHVGPMRSGRGSHQQGQGHGQGQGQGQGGRRRRGRGGKKNF